MYDTLDKGYFEAQFKINWKGIGIGIDFIHLLGLNP